MFEKVLVPLDGSEAAEDALAPAFSLARQYGSRIILLRVACPDLTTVGLAGMHSPLSTTNVDYARERSEAQAYLDEVLKHWAATGVSIQTQVLIGAPAELIVKVAREERVDLIVMSTHGRSGVSRLVYGSVAEAVLRGARTPMLLIPIAS
jgi:nucleotide-binding universal stress UspA family protein